MEYTSKEFNLEMHKMARNVAGHLGTKTLDSQVLSFISEAVLEKMLRERNQTMIVDAKVLGRK